MTQFSYVPVPVKETSGPKATLQEEATALLEHYQETDGAEGLAAVFESKREFNRFMEDFRNSAREVGYTARIKSREENADGSIEVVIVPAKLRPSRKRS